MSDTKAIFILEKKYDTKHKVRYSDKDHSFYLIKDADIREPYPENIVVMIMTRDVDVDKLRDLDKKIMIDVIRVAKNSFWDKLQKI